MKNKIKINSIIVLFAVFFISSNYSYAETLVTNTGSKATATVSAQKDSEGCYFLCQNPKGCSTSSSIPGAIIARVGSTMQGSTKELTKVNGWEKICDQQGARTKANKAANAAKPKLSEEFILAAEEGDLKVIQRLIKNGPVNAKAHKSAKVRDGKTILMIASDKGYQEMVQQLLNAKADVNAKCDEGLTALMFASGRGYQDVVKLLLDAKADVNAKSSDGTTALVFASSLGHQDVVKLLLDANVDVNATDNNGSTALMFASNSGHQDVVKLLLDAKADVNAKARDGSTALREAYKNGNDKIVQLLKNAGAS